MRGGLRIGGRGVCVGGGRGGVVGLVNVVDILQVHITPSLGDHVKEVFTYDLQVKGIVGRGVDMSHHLCLLGRGEEG